MKRRRGIALLSLVILALSPITLAQDAHEALGPKDQRAPKGARHPLQELMTTRISKLRPELIGKHPRVFFTDAELDALRERARTTHKDKWHRAILDVRALRETPPAPGAPMRRAHNTVGLAIAQAAFVYRIEGDKKYLDAAKRYMDAAVSYSVWGYPNSKPNVDLAAGHLLYGLGIGYDLLYNDLTPEERTTYRDKLARQCKLMADHYRLKPGRTFSYSQNHVFIPIAGFAVAAYALYDEVPEAPQWAALARAIYDRVLATYSPDGYYYEGFEYWVFATPWIIHYLDAHKHATGEDLFDQPGLRQSHLYLAHVLAPGGETMFDLGDVFEGPITRARHGEEYRRSHPGGRLHTNYNLLYRLAQRFQDSEIQGVAAWMDSQDQVDFEQWWSLAWYDDKLAAKPMSSLTPWHYFTDHEVVFWRTDWTANATAFAFKSGPPEGHHTNDLLRKFRDWHLSAGHSHPDANSFIIWANGRYLTGDSGYAGVPKTEQHNTVLIDGRGQGKEGRGHDPWDGVPYERLNTIRIVEAQLSPTFAHVEAEAAGAYEPEVGLRKFDRHFMFVAPGQFYVWDDLQTEQPRVFTTLLHSDSDVPTVDSRTTELPIGGTHLALSVLAPTDAVVRSEANMVTAPGPPGAVDKGEVQHRGNRIAISSKEPMKHASFFCSLKVENDTATQAATRR